jgi:hypothetical protein
MKPETREALREYWLVYLFIAAAYVVTFWVFGFPPRQTWVPLLLIALMPYVLKKLRHSVR